MPSTWVMGRGIQLVDQDRGVWRTDGCRSRWCCSRGQQSCVELLGKEARSAARWLITQGITDSMSFVYSAPLSQVPRGPRGSRSRWIPELYHC